MLAFIALISEVLLIPLTIGSTTLPLGAVALGGIILDAGIDFYHSVSEIDGAFIEEQNDSIDEYIADARFEARHKNDPLGGLGYFD